MVLLPGAGRAVWMKPLSGHWKAALCTGPERLSTLTIVDADSGISAPVT